MIADTFVCAFLMWWRKHPKNADCLADIQTIFLRQVVDAPPSLTNAFHKQLGFTASLTRSGSTCWDIVGICIWLALKPTALRVQAQIVRLAQAFAAPPLRAASSLDKGVFTVQLDECRNSTAERPPDTEPKQQVCLCNRINLTITCIDKVSCSCLNGNGNIFGSVRVSCFRQRSEHVVLQSCEQP